MQPELPRILVVDDEVENLKALQRTLRASFEVVTANSAEEALPLLDKFEFSVVISDQRMPGMLGTDFLAKVAKISPDSTRIILTAFTDTKIMLAAINRAQIYRYVTKPWDNRELITIIQQAAERFRLIRENSSLSKQMAEQNEDLRRKDKELSRMNEHLEKTVQQRTSELREVNERLSQLAMVDPLTKVYNRRAFFAKFAEEVERSRRYRHTLCVIMIDVDHFKTFNDMEGHLYGDEALRKVAQTITTNLRKTDTLGRYGGEEFILLMPETKMDDAVEICNRLRETIETTPFQGREEPAYLTVSMGVAGFPEQGEEIEVLVEAADRALYQAKEFGRNRVMY